MIALYLLANVAYLVTLPIETIKNATEGLQELEETLNRGRDANKRLQIIVLGEVSEPSK